MATIECVGRLVPCLNLTFEKVTEVSRGEEPVFVLFPLLVVAVLFLVPRVVWVLALFPLLDQVFLGALVVCSGGVMFNSAVLPVPLLVSEPSLSTMPRNWASSLAFTGSSDVSGSARSLIFSLHHCPNSLRAASAARLRLWSEICCVDMLL